MAISVLFSPIFLEEAFACGKKEHSVRNKILAKVELSPPLTPKAVSRVGASLVCRQFMYQTGKTIQS
jgi:hypothetical protein